MNECKRLRCKGWQYVMQAPLWVSMCGLLACSGRNDDTSPGEDQGVSMTLDAGVDASPGEEMGEPDAGPALVDMRDSGVAEMGDMPADMSPPDLTCQDYPSCARGYTYNDACECIAPSSRGCESDAECREGEVCKEVPRSSGDRTVKICYLDPASLVVEVCPGAPDCMMASTGGLKAAAVSKIVTPQGFETARPEGLDGAYMTFDPPLRATSPWNDCGYDGLCPGDAGYVAPDAGEGDGEMQGMWIAGFGVGRPAQY